jgi:rhodanese-related sulfurtransferase
VIRKALAVVAAILGALALFSGSPRRVAEVTPVELAEWIRDRKPELRIIDTRPESEFDEYHVPRAERVDIKSASFKPNETIVFVSGDATTIDRQVYILRGGMRGWIDEVMNPTITANASPAERAAFQRASVASRYFGGVPRVVDKLPIRSDDAFAAAKAVRRRGC